MSRIVELIFYSDLVLLFILLTGVCWSVAIPSSRIWPPPSKKSWQYYLTWLLFYLVFGLNFLLIILDWNNWIFDDSLRFTLGIPLALIGTGVLIWSITTLGVENTSGSAFGFIRQGPYRFTRNPQYLGDAILFVGLSLCTNSLYLWITHLLLILVFIITPISEEDWLIEKYGEEYEQYKINTPRFL